MNVKTSEIIIVKGLGFQPLDGTHSKYLLGYRPTVVDNNVDFRIIATRPITTDHVSRYP
jgi:hypothetical protein